MISWCHCRSALLLATLGLAAHRVAAGDDATERARIATERAAVEARFVERERECATRFVVTACVEDARREQRAELASLRQQQAVLDEAQRKQRAAERVDKLSKPRADEARPPTTSATRDARMARPPAEASPADPARQPKPPQPARPRKAVVPKEANDRPAQEAARQAEFAARTQAAQAHRVAVEQRQAERLKKKGRIAQPLPVPASAVAP
jgi:colicin import membrane protein